MAGGPHLPRYLANGLPRCPASPLGTGRMAFPTCAEARRPAEKVWNLKGMWTISRGRRKSWGVRLPRGWNMSSSRGVCRPVSSLKYRHSRLSRMRLEGGETALGTMSFPVGPRTREGETSSAFGWGWGPEGAPRPPT